MYLSKVRLAHDIVDNGSERWFLARRLGVYMCHTSRTDSPSADDHSQCMLGIWYHNSDKLGSYERRKRKNHTRKKNFRPTILPNNSQYTKRQEVYKTNGKEIMFSSLAPELGALLAQTKEYRTRLKNVFPIGVEVSVVPVQVRYASGWMIRLK